MAQLSNNPTKAESLVAQADELEEALDKEHKAASAIVTMFQPVSI